MKVRLISLGCAKNRVDSEYILGNLMDGGIRIAQEGEKADAVIVNTCGFLESACEEAIDVILECTAEKENGSLKAVLVAGCLPNRYGRDLAAEMPEIDGIITPGAYDNAAGIVKKALHGEKAYVFEGKGYLGGKGRRVLTNSGHFAYLKVSDGCDNRCAYCMIPDIRGNHSSKPIEELIQEARMLVAGGVKELVVIAQDTTMYGTDLYGKARISELLRKLADIDKLKWIRLMYAYPDRVDEELIALYKDGLGAKLASYIDLTMQHGSGKILSAMNRTGGPEKIVSVVEKLRSADPEIAIRTTFMVGFPGETESEFRELLDFIREVKPQRAGIFRFSPEEGTPAAAMPNQVADEDKLEREKQVMKLLAEISLGFNESRIGKVTDVIVDGPSEESELLVNARSYAEAPEEDGHILVGDASLSPGTMLKVRITSASEYDLGAEIL